MRDFNANLVAEVCHDVCMEMNVQTLAKYFGASVITEDGAKLDIAANGFWGDCFEHAYFDVAFNPHALSN